MQIDRHIDGALDAEQHDEAGGGEAAERILVARGHDEAAQHDEGEDRGDEQAGDDAELLAVTAKMKSVWASGRMRLTVPSPGPLPNQPPERKLPSAVSTWKVSTMPPPAPGSMNLMMRARTCGTNL